jgi:hypothetical protein
MMVDTGLLRAFPNPLGIGLSGAVIVVAAALAFVPVAGRTAEDWVPTVARRAGQATSGTRQTRPARRPGRRRSPAGPRPLLPRPAAFRGLVFDELARPDSGPVGLVRDRTTGTLTAILAVRGRSFTLLDAADKDRRLGSWSTVLAGLAREDGPVRSLQWVERTVPADTEALVRHLDRARAVASDHPTTRSYATLVAEAAPIGQDHECFVALTIGPTRRRGGGDLPAVLLRELRLLEGQLRTADVEIDHALSRREIGAVLRTGFDPWARTDISRRAAAHPDRPGPEPDRCWPAASDDTWSGWHTDDAWHATYWVAEWPRSDVASDFLSPLLLHTGAQRSVAVIMGPVQPSAAVREAEAARTAQIADEQLRQRAGFLATARRRREAEGVARREAELSDGHAAYRFSGYVTVTADSPVALEVACGEVVQAAHQARLELRLLFGVQDLAFTWALPLGRGLAER